MAQQYHVTERSGLLAFLFATLKDWPKKRVKQRLQGAGITVNGEVQTRHDFMLSPDDTVAIGTPSHTRSHSDKTLQRLEILYQDQDIIAINKPAGLLSVGTAKENKLHALALLRTQLSRGKRSIRLWPVHRLDRETSGILLFATSKEVREAIMEKWAETDKRYLAIVEGTPKVSKESITMPLRMDAHTYHMHVGEHPEAKSAITHYSIRQSAAKRSLLEVRIETGRQHQIRAHMAWMGHPVVGDERYGTKGERMGLHAYKLHIIHPVSKKVLRLEVEPAQDFYKVLV